MKQNKCFFCREPGHRAANCPQKKRLDAKTRAVEQEDKESANEADEEPELALNAVEEEDGADF